MLHALKNQLLLLSESGAADFNSAINRRMGTRKEAKIEEDLRNFILVIPEMLSQVRAWVDDPALPQPLRHMHGFVLTYLYHPADYLPEEKHGFFGYLDDAYLVGTVYVHTLQNVDKTKVRFLPNQADLSTQVPGWIATAKKVIPKESRKIETLLHKLMQGDASVFDRMMQTQPS